MIEQPAAMRMFSELISLAEGKRVTKILQR